MTKKVEQINSIESGFDLESIEYSGVKYNKEDLIRTGCAMLVEGSLRKTSKVTGVPHDTIQWWKNQPWWENVMRECRKIKQKELDEMMSSVIHDAIEGIKDRLTHGDAYVETKTGEIKRKPINAKDLSVISGVLFDKRALIRGDATSHSLRSTSNDETLRKLEKRFVSFAQKMENEGKKEKVSVQPITAATK